MNTSLQERFQAAVTDVPDFPKAGVVFKDLSRFWGDPSLCSEVIAAVAEEVVGWRVDAVAGVESRGFILGMPLALALKVPFVPLRKQGKLPGSVFSASYALEYGEATLELQRDAITQGSRVLVHDDVLATGGTARACETLIERAGATVVGWSFLIELGFLNGRKALGSGGRFARPLLST
jgi:adenine phosphoribosyltransferase